MKKKFILNLILLIGLNLIIKPFWLFGIDIGVQNAVGAETYGFYFALFNFTFLFNILLDMGISNFNNRNIAQNKHLLGKHFSKIITLRFLLGFFYAGVTLLIAWLVGYDKAQFSLIYILIFNQFLSGLILYLRSNIAALLLFKTDSFLSITDRSLMILFCAILLWSPFIKQPFQIEWFVYAQTVAYLVTAAIAFTIVARKSHFLKLNFDKVFMLMILKKSFPFALLTLLMSFYNRIDSVMIERILPVGIADYQAGIYASAYRFLDAFVMIAVLFAVLLLPLFSKMLKEKINIQPIVISSFNLLIFFSVTSVLCLSVYAENIMSLLYKSHFSESSQVFIFLIPALIPISMSYIFGTLLTANGNLKQLNIIAFIGIGINLILNFILIPKFGAQGAAITGLATQSSVFIAQFFLVFKIFKLPFSSLKFFNVILYIASLVLIVIVVKNFIPLEWFIQLFIIGFTACILAILSGLINIKEIRQLFYFKKVYE